MTFREFAPTRQMLRHAFKTALAAAISLYISHWIGLEYAYWAAISAIIVMQADLGGSIQAGFSRFTGTFIGAGVGILCLSVLPPSPTLLACGVFIVILFCSCFPGLKGSFRIAGITVAIVVIGAPPGASPIFFGMERCLEIVVGVVSAVVISVTLWPSRAAYLLRHELGIQLLEAASLYRAAMEHLLDKGPGVNALALAGLSERVRHNRELLAKARRESAPFSGREAALLGRFTDAMERLAGHARALDRLARSLPSSGYQAKLDEDMRALTRATTLTLQHLAGDITKRPEAGRAPDLRPLLHRAGERMQELRSQGVPCRIFPGRGGQLLFFV